MKTHPILFSAPMVCALLEGRKTQTRRIIKPQPDKNSSHIGFQCGDKGHIFTTVNPNNGFVIHVSRDELIKCPYGKPGDLLWVRESFWSPPFITGKMLRDGADTWPRCYYAADNNNHDDEWCKEHGWKKRPSIFLTRPFSRLTLEITNVRVERLQDISHNDVLAEGVDEKMAAEIFKKQRGAFVGEAYKYGYRVLWGSINGAGSWDANPWVWVIEFIVRKDNIDKLLKARAA